VRGSRLTVLINPYVIRSRAALSPGTGGEDGTARLPFTAIARLSTEAEKTEKD
jgi:hypothetical protein